MCHPDRVNDASAVSAVKMNLVGWTHQTDGNNRAAVMRSVAHGFSRGTDASLESSPLQRAAERTGEPVLSPAKAGLNEKEPVFPRLKPWATALTASWATALPSWTRAARRCWPILLQVQPNKPPHDVHTSD